MNSTPLQQAPLFAGLDESALQMIESHAVVRKFFRNAVVLTEGDRTTFLYVILSGRVKIFCSDEEGRELVISVLGPGDYFGELALIDDGPRAASVMTLEPTRLAVIGRDQFLACLTKEPRLAINLLKDVVRKLRRETENIRNLALMDVYGRVVKLLNELAKERDGQLVLEHLSYREIAARIGASREMVGRVFKELKRGGYVTIEKDLIAIRKRPPIGGERPPLESYPSDGRIGASGRLPSFVNFDIGRFAEVWSFIQFSLVRFVFIQLRFL